MWLMLQPWFRIHETKPYHSTLTQHSGLGRCVGGGRELQPATAPASKSKQVMGLERGFARESLPVKSRW